MLCSKDNARSMRAFFFSHSVVPAEAGTHAEVPESLYTILGDGSRIMGFGASV
jgi:hypothetical protein